MNDLTDFDRKILDIITRYPRLSGHLIGWELAEAWKRDHPWRRWLSLFLAPDSGSIYPSLLKLERLGYLTSRWGSVTFRAARPRLYEISKEEVE